jgi:hypothetical protein
MSDYPFATILRPGRRNRSRRPIPWRRWIGAIALLLALLILALV